MPEKRIDIVQRKDGYYVKIDKYQTGPLPTLEEAQARANREVLVETAKRFSWRTYFGGLAAVEILMVGMGVVLKLDLASIVLVCIGAFIMQSVFSVLVILKLNQ